MDIQNRIKNHVHDFQTIRHDISNWEKEMKLKEEKLRNDIQCESNKELPPVRSKLENSGNEKVVNFDYPREKQKTESRESAQIEKDLGNNSVKSQNWAEAIIHYTKAIDYFNEDPVFYCNRAYCYLQIEKWKEAVDDCNKALQKDPNYVKGYHRRALALQRLNSLNEAHKDFQKALELDPHNKTLKNDLTALEKLMSNQENLTQPEGRLCREESLFAKELGNRAVNQRKWLEAISHYSRAIEIFPKDATFYCNRAFCYLQMKQFKHAETDCTIALQIDDQYAKAYYRRALALQELNQLKEARDDFTKALEIEPSAQVKNELLRLDKLLFDTGTSSSTNAEGKTEVTRETNRNLAYMRKEKGNLFVKKKDWSSAIECYTEACNLHPEEPSFYLNRALCFLKTNQPKKAILDCIRVVEMDPTNVKAYYRRSLAYKDLGNFSKAHDDLLAAFKLDQSDKTIEEELTKLEKFMGLLPQENVDEKTDEIRSDNHDFPLDSKTSRKRLTGERFTRMGAHFIQPAKRSSSQSSHILRDIKIADKSENSLQKALMELSDSKEHSVPIKRKVVPRKIAEQVFTPAPDILEISQSSEEVDVESLSSPKTSMQFVSSWNKLTNLDLRYRFLKKIDGNNFPSIFEDLLESYLFSEILEVLATKFLENNEKVYSYISGLARVKRISALLLFATEEDNAYISLLLNHIEKVNEVSLDKLNSLKSLYYC